MQTITDGSVTSATLRATAAGAEKQIRRVPLATYRLQLRADFTLDRVRELLPYFRQLGISDVYLSPLFRARKDSSHGYDVVDHGTIEPTFGGLLAFQGLAEAVREAGMGILLDVVPNHMGINDRANRWWHDVLENGEASQYADYFDIDWQPAASNLQHKVLLPFLAAPFGQVLENGELQIVYESERLQLAYGPNRFPLSLPTITFLLDSTRALLIEGPIGGADDRDTGAELQEVISELRYLPPPEHDKKEAAETWREKQRNARGRFNELVARSPAVRQALESTLARINGDVGNPRSFDQLEQLIEQQWYRLAYWRVASDEINYRRFFDINDLAAIRVEDPRVFEAVHRLIAHFLEQRWVTGLRIDHPDGLLDPKAYFDNLQALYRAHDPDAGAKESESIYIVAEKILAGDEPLPTEWSVSGTTGYELLNQLSRVLVDADGLTALRASYADLTGQEDSPADVAYESKRTILLSSMASELQMLSAELYRIAQQHRLSRDFTRPVLHRALREIIACLAVYRTYVRPQGWEVSEMDYRRVTTAVRMAKRRNRTMPAAVFDFIASILLLEHPPVLSNEQAAQRRNFALKVQQISGPVAAKGVEDTAFYRYYPLAALNEVGGELDAAGLSLEEFHRLMRHRVANWQNSMSSTSTHDSKRGEDMRARLLVLSEIADDWREAFERWQVMNRPHVRELDGDAVPNANEAHLLYQTLVGTWPLSDMDVISREQYTERIIHYMEKALREAKLHTSWMNPSEAYEAAVSEFVRDILSDGALAFQVDVSMFVKRIADTGFVNSLSQLLLKMTLPGVPDFYQGTELWDFNLVDPDNRRPVDFEARCALVEELHSAANANLARCARQVGSMWPDPRVKLLVTMRCLALRSQWPDVFTRGDYLPLVASGPAADHIVAFARRTDDRCAISVAPRHVLRLRSNAADHAEGVPQLDWGETRLVLPPEMSRIRSWSCQLSGRAAEIHDSESEPTLEIAALLEVLPVALLTPDLH